MPGPAGIHTTLNAAMSAAGREAASRHALHHGPPYSKQLQQQFLSSRNRGANNQLTPPTVSDARSSEDPTSSTYPGSPWTPPPTQPEAIDIYLGLPLPEWDPHQSASSTGCDSPRAASSAGGTEQCSGADVTGTDGDGGERAATGSGGGARASGYGGMLTDGQVQAVVVDGTDDTGGGVVIDDCVSWSSRYFSSRDATLDGGVVADRHAAGGAQRRSNLDGVPGVTAPVGLERGDGDYDTPSVPYTEPEDATTLALSVPSPMAPQAYLAQPLPRPLARPLPPAASVPAAVSAAISHAAPRVAVAHITRTVTRASDGYTGRAGLVALGGAGGSAAFGTLPDLTAVGFGTGSTGVSSVYRNMSGGVTGVALLPQLASLPGGLSASSSSPPPGNRVARPSWAGSHDSSPPSTSGSASGAAAAGGLPTALGATTASRRGGTASGFTAAAAAAAGASSSGRRAIASAAEWPFQSGGAGNNNTGTLGTAGLELGLVGSGVVALGSGRIVGFQSSTSRGERAASTNIQIEVSAAALATNLNIQGRGAGTNTTPSHASRAPRQRGRTFTTAATTAAPAAATHGVSFGQQKGSSSVSVAPPATAANKASHVLHSSAMWSSARKLRNSLHRLHQQYQNYHALQGGQELSFLALQLQRSDTSGGGCGLRSEASGLSAAIRLRISGHGHDATSTVPGEASTAGAAGVGDGGREAQRRRSIKRTLSAPNSSRSALGMSGLRMQPDTWLQLDRESSRGIIPTVASVNSFVEFDKGFEEGLAGGGGGGSGGAPRFAQRGARSLPVSPRVAKSSHSRGHRRARSAGGGLSFDDAAAAAGGGMGISSPRSAGTGSSPTASPRAAAGATVSGTEAPRGVWSSLRPSRRASAHPVLIMPSMAATTAAEDPDLVEVLEKARRRAAVEKQKRRAAREVRVAAAAAAAAAVTAADSSGGSGSGGGGGGRSMRRRIGTSAPRTASEKAKVTELLVQRQAEEWARTHRQMPPRRRLAPSVIKMVERWFELVDDDGSGHLETKELAAALQAAGVPCSENDVIELVSTIDANHDGAVSLSEFLAFLLKELGAGKNLSTGDYLLPSGGQLPFAAMIARLKRLRVLDDVMKGGKARNRYVDMLYNRDALAAEMGLSEQVAATFQARAVPLDPYNSDDPNDPMSASIRRGGRVRLQQLFQQYRQAQECAAFDSGEVAGMAGPMGPLKGGVAAPPPPLSEPSNLDVFGLEVGRFGSRGEEAGDLGRGRLGLMPHSDGNGYGYGYGGGGGQECDSDYDAIAAGFGEKVRGVSYYPRHSQEVSMLQGACLSQRTSAGNAVLLGPGTRSPEVDESMFFQLTEVLLPLAEASAISGVSHGDGGGEEQEEGEGGALGATGTPAPEGEASYCSDSTVKAAVAAGMAVPRLLLPIISPLPPVKRPNTRAFKRALLDVRHSAPEYLMQRLGLAGPREAAAAAAATAGRFSPTQDRPRGRRRTGGEGGGSGAAAAAGAATGHATASFRPLASTAPAGLSANGEFSTTSVSVLTTASDPVTASNTASKAAAAAARAYYTMYGAGFTRYKRWSMYDIDPAAENPDYWQAKAAALLMRRTNRAVRGVPGAGVASVSAAAAAAAAAIAVADAAKDIELSPLSAPAAATEVRTGNYNSSSEKHLLPSASAQKQHPSLQPQTDSSAEGGLHLPCLQTGAVGSGGGTAASSATRISVPQHPSMATSPGGAATDATGTRGPPSAWRRGAEEPAYPGSPTRHMGRTGPHGRGLGAGALGRGSAAAAVLLSAGGVTPSPGSAAIAANGRGSPAQYVIRPQHGANPRLAAEALRRRRPVAPIMEGDPFMERLLSKSASRSSPHRSPAQSPQRSPARSPQTQLRPPMERRSPALPSVRGP